MNINILPFALLLVASKLWAGAAEAETNKLSPQTAFKEAASLMEKGRYKEALPYLEQVQREYPDDTSVLWNLGIAHAETGNLKEAVKIWQRYRKIAPNEWQAVAKLVQAYQGSGDFKARDEAIVELYSLRKGPLASDIAKAERFCREQWITANGRKVFAFEYFDPQGVRQKLLRFSVVDASGMEDFYISLGSYDDTTEIARELKKIPTSNRLYHLDEYSASGHKTYAFFNFKPGYDQVRTNVVNILEGKMKPISSSSK